MESFFQKINQGLSSSVGLSTKYERFSISLFVRGFVLFMHFCPFYVTNWDAVEFLPNEMDKFIYKALMNLCISLSIASYFIASYRQPKILSVATQDESHFVEEGQDQNNLFCQICRQWKAARAHHCQMCGKCVPRMDHHCLLLVNCVGYHNLKPFFLSCFYQILVLTLWFSIVYERFFGDDQPAPMSALSSILFWIALIFSLPYVVFITLLFLRTYVQMYSNMTTIEAMGNWRGNKYGAVQERLPFIGIKKSQLNKVPNQYDLLWPNNLRLVLGTNVFTWPIPWIIPNVEEHGYNYQQIPAISTDELGKLERDGFLDSMQSSRKVKYEIKEKFVCNIDDYVSKAMEKYQNADIVLQKTPTTVREKVDPNTINDELVDKDN